MSSGKDVRGFPDVHSKLQQPTKQSAFDKQRAEAEAKRQREAEETAAVYKDFVKSFDDDVEDEDDGTAGVFGGGRARGGFAGAAPIGGAPGRRHFGTGGLKSGPGSLGPPPAFGKKRSFRDFSRGGRERHNDDRGPHTVSKAFDASDDEDTDATKDRAEEKAAARPTLRLLNIPPGMSPAAVKALLPQDLRVESVKLQPPGPSGGSERKSATALVVLSQDTPANEMDSVVSLLQGRYLGYGFYLSLHRHLSSAVATSAALSGNLSSNADSHPFGAKPVEGPSDRGSRPMQQGFHKGFAPPSSYDQAGANVSRSSLLHVPVKPPKDVGTLQLINKVIEGILEHGMEYEALMMSRPQVQNEEKWSWIWDARSDGGIWYRWRLWEIVTGIQSGRSGKYVPLFDGSHAWKVPEKRLAFEYATNLDEFVSDSDYNSSDDEDIEMDEKRENQTDENEKTFLNPLEKAKLTHLLARLPTTMSKLRKGDIGRVTCFAIMHASRGVDEVVDIIVSNVEQPFSLTRANPSKSHDSTNVDETAAADDASAARLIGLYVVSDILSSSSTSGVRHAWRFRQLFETALRDRKVFEGLGLMAEKHGWGRLRAEKWKRSVGLILHLWEGWCVFPTDSQDLFTTTFENPPSAKVLDKAEAGEKSGKWKAVEVAPPKQAVQEENKVVPAKLEAVEVEDVEGEPIVDDDVDGEPIMEDDIDGEPIDDDDVEGEPISDMDVDGEPMEEDDVFDDHAAPKADHEEAAQTEGVTATSGGMDESSGQGSGAARSRKPRMRAVDMFADSDESDSNR